MVIMLSYHWWLFAICKFYIRIISFCRLCKSSVWNSGSHCKLSTQITFLDYILVHIIANFANCSSRSVFVDYANCQSGSHYCKIWSRSLVLNYANCHCESYIILLILQFAAPDHFFVDYANCQSGSHYCKICKLLTKVTFFEECKLSFWWYYC